ncbi:di-heme oxidoredictase family protein [Candidatus Marinarcus aquaticus]|uniref:Thiol oxidoreductase n=1 Tax=Candidatus Marinarcus aquaticus TaxID=2044504 RepID=A0A4Q0XSX5_9BACT|nr:di-heme oxidoredictase family protein [Candidatus Marinarcus aquaticus]RXJ60580.1 thiol oxidoreductase [Candidatus Marinarcus aquaticus]
MKSFITISTLTALLAVSVFAVQTTHPSKKAFTKPYDGLNDEQIDLSMLGKSFFRIPWVEAPSATTARDGLGPLFNANSCISCHPNNALGSLFTKDGNISRSVVVRLSIDSNNSQEHQALMQQQGFVPHPVYGAQLAINGVKDVPFEGRLKVVYEQKKVVYPDGDMVYLNVPHYSLIDLNYGEISKQTHISVRKAPALVGLGYVDAISDEAILANEDVNDANKDGISGRVNWVYSKEKGGLAVGKYTYKASAPTVKNQIANAFFNDMSLTTSFYGKDNCTSYQKECLNAPHGRDEVDVPDLRLDAIDFYLKHLKVPVVENKDAKAEQLFEQIGCTSCHIPSLSSSKGKPVYVYSDFLLHDMGEELSDGRVEFMAQANEWRTAPLWGINSYDKAIGQSAEYLHDGRAKSLEEAILWHGGEALNAKKAFMNLAKQDREKLLKFLGEL